MPSARYAHPEFGYLWPVPGVRRALRVAMRSIVLGALIGAAGFIARSAGGDRTGYSALETWTATSAAEIVRSFAVEPMRRARQSGSAKPEDNRTGATKVACGDDSLGTLEDTCVVPKPRRVRAPAATNSPTIARVTIGRTAALSTGLGAADRSPANRRSLYPRRRARLGRRRSSRRHRSRLRLR
jgi:hypothetical protein